MADHPVGRGFLVEAVEQRVGRFRPDAAGGDQHSQPAKAIGAHFRAGERHGDGQMVEIGRAANNVLQHVGPEVAAHVEVDVVVAQDGVPLFVEQFLRQAAVLG